LARGQSGKIVERIRNEKGLAYEVNLQHDANCGFGIFAVYLNSYKRNINQIKRIIIGELNSLRNPKERDIKIAKGFIEGHYKLDNEDTFRLADKLAFWEHIGSAKLHYSYIDTIKGVTRDDIIKVSKKYLDKNFTMALIAQN
jgi:predicted Zn-dependent peptidase